jgi:hypothetical protein
MAKPSRAPHRLALDEIGELPDLPGGPPDLEPVLDLNGEAGRVITSVLQPTEPVEEDAGRITLSYISDDAAHARRSPQAPVSR